MSPTGLVIPSWLATAAADRERARNLAARFESEVEALLLFATWTAGQPCQCEDVAFPGSGGPKCAPCDASSFLLATQL